MLDGGEDVGGIADLPFVVPGNVVGHARAEVLPGRDAAAHEGGSEGHGAVGGDVLRMKGALGARFPQVARKSPFHGCHDIVHGGKTGRVALEEQVVEQGKVLDSAVGGRGRVVMPAGMTIDQMTLTGDLGMKIVISPKRGWSRSAQIAELREAFEGLDHRLRLLGQKLVDEGTRNDILAKHDAAPDRKPDDADRWDSQAGAVRFGDDFAGKDLISEEDLSDQDRGLLAIRNGDERVWLACATASDVVHGKKWVSDMGLLEQTVFVVTAAAWKAAAELSGAGLGVVLQGALWHVERNPVTYKEVETFAPKVFHDAGVTFALGSNGQLLGPNLQGYQAATCVREGVPRSVALDAVTRVPAQMWGLEGQIGTLTAGADGSFVLLDGDPLDVSSRVLEVWMRGIRTYDRTTDERLQRLTEGR